MAEIGIFKFRLETTDPHWVRLNQPNPNSVSVDIGDWWENRTIGKGGRNTIDIQIPEILGAKGKIKIRWYSNDWHGIGLSKSKDGVNYTSIWGRSAHYTFDEVYEIDLDGEYQYYRIDFADGDLDYEVTRVHKDIEVTITELLTGSLRFITTPKEVEIYIGTSLIGTTDPTDGVLLIGNLSPGPVTYTAKKTGYSDISGTVTVQSGTIIDVLAVLTLLCPEPIIQMSVE